jgi:hypothetical protein
VDRVATPHDRCRPSEPLPSAIMSWVRYNLHGLETAGNSMHIAIMPEKQPKRPNNYAKALESWESEGGAPASHDYSTNGKRPRELNQITKAQPPTDHKQKPRRA